MATSLGKYVPEEYRRIVTIIALFLIIMPIVGSYNMLIDKDVTVKQMQSNVQTSIERRADLVPNLVSTIQGSGKFEKSTLVDVIAERSQSQQIKENIATAQTPSEIQAQETSLSGVIGRLMLVYEQYPTLKTTDGYKELVAQLTDSENQIQWNRNNYNTAVRDYQQTTRSFPINIVAIAFGFNQDKYQMFAAISEKQTVPAVNF
jgi:LemA protein